MKNGYLTLKELRMINPHVKPFCLEIGEEHSRDLIIIEYRGRKKHGTKQIKCPKCNRILLKNGQLVIQDSSICDMMEKEIEKRIKV